MINGGSAQVKGLTYRAESPSDAALPWMTISAVNKDGKKIAKFERTVFIQIVVNIIILVCGWRRF